MPTPRQSDLVAIASRLLEVPTVRYHKTDTNSMSRSRKHVAVEEPKQHEARICLSQHLLRAEVCGAECAKPGSGGRGFGSPARGPSPQHPTVGRVLNAR